MEMTWRGGGPRAQAGRDSAWEVPTDWDKPPDPGKGLIYPPGEGWVKCYLNAAR